MPYRWSEFSWVLETAQLCTGSSVPIKLTWVGVQMLNRWPLTLRCAVVTPGQTSREEAFTRPLSNFFLTVS